MLLTVCQIPGENSNLLRVGDTGPSKDEALDDQVDLAIGVATGEVVVAPFTSIQGEGHLLQDALGVDCVPLPVAGWGPSQRQLLLTITKVIQHPNMPFKDLMTQRQLPVKLSNSICLWLIRTQNQYAC